MIPTKAWGTGDPKELPLLLWLDLVWTHLEDAEIIYVMNSMIMQNNFMTAYDDIMMMMMMMMMIYNDEVYVCLSLFCLFCLPPAKLAIYI